MLRLHRYGTVAFTVCLLGLVFHLLALSYNNWLKATCEICPSTDFFKYWTVSIQQRCYRVSIPTILYQSQSFPLNISSEALTTEFCLPKQRMFAVTSSAIDICVAAIKQRPHLVCSAKLYDPNYCRCDYSSRTKAVVALAVISSFCLGCVVLLTHFTSYVAHDLFINFLVRGGLAALVVASICMLSILVIFGTSKNEDAEGISGYVIAQDYLDDWNGLNTTNYSSIYKREHYTVTIGWSFGLEIVALIFILGATVIYALMLTAKRRPEK